MPINYNCDCDYDCNCDCDCEFNCDCDCDYHCDYHCDMCDNVITGNVVDIDLCKEDSEVRADVTVENSKRCCVRVWGQVKDCYGNPVPDAQIKLLKTCYYHGKMEYEGVAHTTSDCLGFYQFDVFLDKDRAKYRILVGKASTGKERVIRKNDRCKPCK